MVAAAATALLCLASYGWGQVAQLPAITVEEPIGPVVIAEEPPVFEFPAPADVPVITDQLPKGARNGFFQKAMLTNEWLAREGHAGLGMVDLELKGVFALPCPTRDWPLLIMPGFGVHFLDAPTADLPPRVYDAFTTFRWIPKLSDRWMIDSSVTPGVYRDFEEDTGDGLRVTAHAAGVYSWSPTTKIALGAMYLDRRDWNVLPVGGILWNPSEDVSVELLFPQSRIAKRVDWFGAIGDEVEDWVYLSGEFGDWIWAIRRSDGARDRVAYRDIRLLAGLERKIIGLISARGEVGYAFSRKLSAYDTATPDLEPPGTVLLRAVVSY